jgi:hypothetical protein
MRVQLRAMKKPRTKEEAAYLGHVHQHMCALCGRMDQIEAHHVKLRGRVAMGKRPSDYMCTPLCTGCHRRVHDHPVTHEDRWRMAETALWILATWIGGGGA